MRLVEREREPFFRLHRRGCVPRAAQAGDFRRWVDRDRVGHAGGLFVDQGIVRPRFTLHGLGRSLRHDVESIGIEQVAHPGPASASLGTVAVDKGANHLAARGDVGKRREINPERKRRFSRPSLALIDQQHIQSIMIGNLGMRGEKREDVRKQHDASSRASSIQQRRLLPAWRGSRFPSS